MRHEIDKLRRQFLEHLEIGKGRSLKTVANYEAYLSRFFEQAKVSVIEDISDESVRQFRLWLNRKGLKKNTQNYHLIALRSFLKYLAFRGISSLSPERIELAKVGARDLDLISPQELERLLSAPSGSDLKSLRDRAILELLFSTGLRVSELCSLNIDDIDLSADEFSVRGKGEKVRVVFLSNTAKLALKTYLAKRKDIENEALFTNLASGNRLTSRSIERIVKKYGYQGRLGQVV